MYLKCYNLESSSIKIAPGSEAKEENTMKHFCGKSNLGILPELQPLLVIDTILLLCISCVHQALYNK